MTKRTNQLRFIFCFFLLLTGCSNASTTEIKEIEEHDREEQTDFSGTTLNVIFGLDDSEWALFREKILPAFKLQTGIEIEAIDARSDGMISTLQSAEEQIDLFAMDVNNLSQFVQLGLVEDLSSYSYMIPTSIVQGMVDASTFDESLLFMPFRPNVEITFFNESLLSQYGLNPPANWDELLHTARTLHNETGTGRIAIKANSETDMILHLFDFIKQAGGDPYVLNDTGSIEAFMYLQELYPYLSQESQEANWDTMNQYLESDSVYIGKNWPFYIPEFHSSGKVEIKAYSGWHGPERASHVLGGDVLGIPKGSENVEAAMMFAQYLMSKPVQEVLANELAWPPVRFDSYGIIEGYQEPFFETIQNVLQDAEPRGNKPYWSEIEPIYIEVFESTVINGNDVETTLQHAAEQIRAIQANYQ
ncbi:ABC transporter substrate-binding protein [Halalkalibacter okhensis]|uniref:ABC transporter substrate-binding protein n=1 Tax=Halalkalibacter okhensis TaxID=333138 RepID=UPI00068F1FEA|nr:extracellular solute-binding protein [Halalkalibacter okhensis]